MKSILPFAALYLCLLAQMPAMAQDQGGENEDFPTLSIRPQYGVQVNRVDTDTLSAWLNQAAVLSDQSSQNSYFRNYLYPDSTVDVIFTTGVGPVWKHSFGQVLHPANSLWHGFNGVFMDNNEAYSLDSVALYYRYFRWNDVAPDTLLMQVWDDSEVFTNANPGWASGASYANVDYDFTARKGLNPVMEYTYLLENKDSAGFASQRRLVLPVGLPFDTGRVAVTFTFFPGHTSSEGDTIDVYDVGTVANKVNALVVYELRDEAPNVIPGDFNNGLSVTRSVRYNENTNGWNGNYQPGTSWASSSGIYHLDMDFKISYEDHGEPVDTTSGVGVNELTANQLRLMPNPTSDFVTIEGDAIAGSSYVVYDLTGRQMLNGILRSDRALLDVSALDAGSYFVLLEGADLSTASTLIVQD